MIALSVKPWNNNPAVTPGYCISFLCVRVYGSRPAAYGLLELISKRLTSGSTLSWHHVHPQASDLYNLTRATIDSQSQPRHIPL